MKNLIKHPVLITSIVAVAALAVGIYAYDLVTSGPRYDYSAPKVEDVTENVAVTGQAKAADVVDLAFERAGKVSRTYVSVGDNVTTGQAIVALNAQDALNDLASAKASLALAQAQADIQGTESNNAAVLLSEAEISLLDKIQSAYITSDDAVRTEASQLFTDPTNILPQFNIASQNYQLTVQIQNERSNLGNTLVNWNFEISQASATTTNNWNILSGHARQNVLAVKQFLDDCATALDNAVVDPSVSQNTMSGWKLVINTSRQNIAGVLVSLSAADSQLTSAESAHIVAQQQVQSGTNTTESTSQAQVDQAQVAVDRAESALAKTVLRAPFDGVVTRIDAKVGETVSVGVPMVGMISNANYQIEGYVSETDAAKIYLGQSANVTLDAYGNSVIFPAKVVLVDPAETVQNGVSSYKVTFEFINNDARIKSGMTANVSVFIDSKKGVLTVPKSAIVRRGADEYVLVAAGPSAAAILTKVTTGITGDDGSVEIISGITASSSIVSLTETQ